jgi:hypothetical protein
MHLSFGNRCGHNTADPTLDVTRPIPIGPGGYPRILAVAAERIEAFYCEPEGLPSLAVNDTSSQKRSERREALIRLLKAIFKFLDLVSLTVAVRDTQAALQNLTIDTIAKHADLELRRAERALSDLAGAGFIFTSQKRIRNPDGGFRSVPALKRVSPALFAALGLEVALKLERTKAQKRLAASTAAHSSPSPGSPRPAVQQESFTFAFHNLTDNIRQFTQEILHQQRGQPEMDIERQRRWNAIALTLREEHPDWPADQIRFAADKALRS